MKIKLTPKQKYMYKIALVYIIVIWVVMYLIISFLVDSLEWKDWGNLSKSIFYSASSFYSIFISYVVSTLLKEDKQL